MDKHSFIFIGDLIETKKQLPLLLFDEFYLKKASKEQRQTIKQFIVNYNNILSFSINKYECSFRKNNKQGYNIVPLKETEWKYYVIEHSQGQAKRQLQLILSLSSPDFTVLFEALYVGQNTTGEVAMPGVMHFQLRTLNYFHDHQIKNFPLPEIKTITQNTLKELQQINSILNNFDKKKFPFIDKALNDFVNIKDISESSPFKILSCFSILELLLTTYRPEENNNSVSFQLRKKINTLNNQFTNRIEIKDYFKGSCTNTIETIIKKLYQYRNDIAHGNLSNFEKDLKMFNNQQKNILPFLIDLLKRILITSLEQPQLIQDLKEH